MSETIRARIERLLTDSVTFQAGQEEERRRLQLLIDARISELKNRGSVPHVTSICNELLRLRQVLNHADPRTT